MKRSIFVALASFAAVLAISSCEKKQEDLPVSAVTIDSSLNLIEGQEKALTIEFTPAGSTGTLVWRSSDSDKVGVANGVVTAREVTTDPVEVYALCGSIKSNICLVTVQERVEPITGIAFDKTELSIEQGGSADLTVILTPETTTDTGFEVEWNSDILSVEILDNVVTVTGRRNGISDVVVVSSADSTIKGTCTVTVTREMYNEDGSYILYDDMISSNAPMSFCSINQDATGVGLINGDANWPDPWWMYKTNEDFLARKTKLALPSNLSDNDLTTCYMTNTDVFGPAAYCGGSYKYCNYRLWGKGCEYMGADLYPGWDGNVSDEGFPIVNSDEDLRIESLVDGHYVQVELPELVDKVDITITNSTNEVVYFRDEDKVVIMLSADGEDFQTLETPQGFTGGVIELNALTFDDYDAQPRQFKFIRLTHNGTTSFTRDFSAGVNGSFFLVDNSGWNKKGGFLFTGNASPIAFAEIKITKTN